MEQAECVGLQVSPSGRLRSCLVW